MKKKTCPHCNKTRIDDYPELIPSGMTDPKVLKCSMGTSCKGLLSPDNKHGRPFEFNYFDREGKPIPYEPPKDGKPGYSPQPGKKFSTKNDPWSNDPANTANFTIPSMPFMFENFWAD